MTLNELEDRLTECEWKRTKLVELIDYVDELKRNIKQDLRDLSNGEKGICGHERIVESSRLKKELSDLTDIRELINRRLGLIKRVKRSSNELDCNKFNPRMFVATAKEFLDKDSFEMILKLSQNMK